MIRSDVQAKLEDDTRGQRKMFVDLDEWNGVTAPIGRVDMDALDSTARAALLSEINEARRAAELRYQRGVAERVARLESAKVNVVVRQTPTGDQFDIYRINGLKLELVEAAITDRALAEQIAQLVAQDGGMTDMGSSGPSIMQMDEG